jgi:hypothetical protein
MPDTEPAEMSSAQYYDRIRDQINQEDQLINIRVVWQLLAQSFLFGTFATLLAASEPSKDAPHDGIQQLFLWLVPITALLTGILSSFSVYASLANVNSLRHLYEGYAKDRQQDSTTKFYPPIQGPENIRRLSQLSPLSLPLVFILAWVVVLVRLVLIEWA